MINFQFIMNNFRTCGINVTTCRLTCSGAIDDIINGPFNSYILIRVFEKMVADILAISHSVKHVQFDN